MQKRLISVALTTVFLGGCGTVAKESTAPVLGDIKSNKGHVADSTGNVVKSGQGECVYNGNWSKDTIINACEGIVDEKKEPAAAPVSVETPKAEPVAAEKAPIVETVVLNSRALFSTDADGLSEKGDQLMRNLIAKLGDFSEVEKVEIVGHTDDRGSDEYNQALSERRAETIKGFLVGEYSDADISTVGMGETEPKASNETAEGRQQNRRVEIRVTAKMVKPAE